MKSRKVLAFLAVMAVVMWFFDYATPLTMTDDVLYRCVWVADENDPELPRTPVSGLGDIIESQTTHYFVTNGRVIVHGVAQAVLAFVGEGTADVTDALLFCLLVWLCAAFATGAAAGEPGVSGRSGDAGQGRAFLAVVLFSFLFFVAMPGFSDVFLWTLGCVNYLWTSVAVMLFLLYFYRVEKASHSVWGTVACLPALIVGWTHEGLTMPLALGLCVWAVVNRRRVLHSRALPAVAGFVVGALLCAFSPATLNRVDNDGMSLVMRIMLGAYNMVTSMRITWVLVVMAAMMWWRRREVLADELRRYYVLYMALMAALGIVLVCGQTAGRVCFFADLFSALLLVRLILLTSPAAAVRPLVVGACAIMVAVATAVAGFAWTNRCNYDYQLTQQLDPAIELIKVRQVPKTGAWLFDQLVDRYVKPSVSFGFYSSYQGFDADDVNLRSAAVLYGKQRVMYLPEDMVERLLAGTVGCGDTVSDSRNEISAVGIPDGRHVDTLRFVLRSESLDSLAWHQRLVAYRGDSYDMPEMKFKTVAVDGRNYLFFARPLTNISRRVKEVKMIMEDGESEEIGK